MNTSDKFCAETFNYKGLWDVDSLCGLRIFDYHDKHVVVVSELYRENPGTSITQAACLLVAQICEKFKLNPEKLIYIEHNPDMHSKLSFYDEEFFEVTFDRHNGTFANPRYTQLTKEQVQHYFGEKAN